MKITSLKTPSGKTFEFVDGVEPETPRLIMASFGPWNTGKSRFGVTGPNTVGIIPVDRKTRRTVEKTIEELKSRGIKKKILMPKTDFIRQINPMSQATMTDEKTKEFYQQHVQEINESAWAMHASPEVKIIVIDLFEQYVKNVRYACYGREKHVITIKGKQYQDYKEADQKVIDFINSLSSKHLLLTCKERAEYVNDVRTNKLTWQAGGFNWLGNHTNLILEHEQNSKWVGEKDDPETARYPDDEERNWRFGLTVSSSQDRLDLMGQRVLVDDQITFGNLATLLYPNVEWDD